jgi:hypothetical protein
MVVAARTTLLLLATVYWSLCLGASDPSRGPGPSESILYRFDDALSSECREAVKAALLAWSGRVPISISECATPAQQRCVTFRLVESSHGDLAPFSFLLNRSLAHTVFRGRYPDEVHFNKEVISEDGIGKRALYQAALHEVGHVIGVPHSRDERSIMYPIRIRTDAGQEILPSDIEVFDVIVNPINGGSSAHPPNRH